MALGLRSAAHRRRRSAGSPRITAGARGFATAYRLAHGALEGHGRVARARPSPDLEDAAERRARLALEAQGLIPVPAVEAAPDLPGDEVRSLTHARAQDLGRPGAEAAPFPGEALVKEQVGAAIAVDIDGH